MAAISITPANVEAVQGSLVETGIFGETITAGQTIYRDYTDGKYYVTDNTDPDKDEIHGIAITGGVLDEIALVLIHGDITIGGTVAVGTVYMISTAGLIVPVADLTTGDYITQVGIGVSTTVIRLNKLTTGVQM